MILNDVDFAKFMALNYSLQENNDYFIIDEFFKNSFESICYEISRLNFYKCKVIYDNDKEIIYIKLFFKNKETPMIISLFKNKNNFISDNSGFYIEYDNFKEIFNHINLIDKLKLFINRFSLNYNSE